MVTGSQNPAVSARTGFEGFIYIDLWLSTIIHNGLEQLILSIMNLALTYTIVCNLTNFTRNTHDWQSVKRKRTKGEEIQAKYFLCQHNLCRHQKHTGVFQFWPVLSCGSAITTKSQQVLTHQWAGLIRDMLVLAWSRSGCAWLVAVGVRTPHSLHPLHAMSLFQTQNP